MTWTVQILNEEVRDELDALPYPQVGDLRNEIDNAQGHIIKVSICDDPSQAPKRRVIPALKGSVRKFSDGDRTGCQMFG